MIEGVSGRRILWVGIRRCEVVHAGKSYFMLWTSLRRIITYKGNILYPCLTRGFHASTFANSDLPYIHHAPLSRTRDQVRILLHCSGGEPISVISPVQTDGLYK